jgi:hypothetical protein
MSGERIQRYSSITLQALREESDEEEVAENEGDKPLSSRSSW